MAVITITKWGNSCGIRLPAKHLKAAKLKVGDELELKSDGKGGFTMRPKKQPREGWLDAFNAIAQAGGDELLMDELPTSFDEDEWQW